MICVSVLAYVRSSNTVRAVSETLAFEGVTAPEEHVHSPFCHSNKKCFGLLLTGEIKSHYYRPQFRLIPLIRYLETIMG